MTGINTFEELLRVVKRISISVSEQTKKYLSTLDKEGVLIDDDNPVMETHNGFFDIAPNGDVLRVSIFINQKTVRGYPRDLTAKDWHKFHLYPCRTIQDYPISRKYRYKKTNNTQGLFHYILLYKNKEYKKEEREKGRKLWLCKNCRDKLPPEFSQYAVSGFPIKEFYQHHPQSDFAETFEFDHDQIPQVYVNNWHEIATGFKEQRNWRCEQCGINLSEDKQYLHAHHQDGNPANNIIANLRALCIACHAEQTMHEHIKQLPDYKEFIKHYKK